ncbi:MAG: hypothetical protein HYS23_05020 [Geobacter sp.]|nr:hypothetical protein [Geobacter sp.]
MSEQALSETEGALGVHFDTVSFYRAWNSCRIEDDIPWLDKITRTHRTILLTWEPWSLAHDPAHPEIQPDFSLQRILSGRYDDYILSFAQALKELPKPLLLRPMHEMNGNWYPWCGTVNNNRVEDFITAWRHIRGLCRKAGDDGIKWVWSPYAHSVPDSEENALESYFPGEEEIDRVGLDGYNWGTTREWSKWQEFGEIFGPAYDAVSTLSRKPVIIAETACAEEGGNKARWIAGMFSDLRERFRRVETVVWFDINKECDWRIVSSGRSQRAFAEAASAFSLQPST